MNNALKTFVLLILVSLIFSSCNDKSSASLHSADQTSWIADNVFNSVLIPPHAVNEWINILQEENQTRISELFPLSLGTSDGRYSVKISDIKTATNHLDQQFIADQTNVITQLYAELLAAKLNIASDMSSEQIADILDEIDFFLAEYRPADWTKLSEPEKDTITFWVRLLHWFNAGELNANPPEVFPHSPDLAFKE